MEDITWCMKQNKGILIVNPDAKLVEEYIRKSLNALQASFEVSDIEWKISARYYSMYFALYAVLTRIGIKCEIHDCTIEFMKFFLNNYYSIKDYEHISIAKKARIDTQYYKIVGRILGDSTKIIDF